MLTNWSQAVAQKNYSQANEIQSKLVPTVTGRKVFPEMHSTLSRENAFEKLSENVKTLNAAMGSKSKHRKDLAIQVTAGLPAIFCQTVLGFDAAYLGQVRKRHRDAPNEPALLTESRTESGYRNSKASILSTLLVEFFESRSYIESGSDTPCRVLTITMDRLEAELFAETPAILRRLHKREPSQCPVASFPADKLLTRLQMDIMAAAIDAERQADFSAAEEYSARLEAELQRFVRQLQ